MVFPKSNLATASQPWGRFVEKSITNLETLVATERVNNAARDAQATLSIKRLDASLATVAELGLQTAQNVADIQTITDSVFSLNTDVNSLESNVYYTGTTEINGYNIRAGTINANAINAGTLTGFTIQTASSGTRVVMGGSTIDFYYGSTQVGTLSGTGVYGNETSLLYPGTSIGIYVTNSSARLDATNSFISASSGQARISGGGSAIYATSGQCTATTAFNAPSLSVNSGPTISTSGYTANGISQPIIGSGGGVYPTNGTTTVGATVIQDGSGAILRRYGSSSRRYKNSEASIWDSEELNPIKLLSLPVKTFKYNDGYLDPDDQNYNKTLPGLMAEDVDDIYPVASYDNKDGLVENWMDRSVLVGTLALVQKLYARVDELEARIQQLEGN